MLHSAPGDYGIAPEALLLRAPEVQRPSDFADFWQEFRGELEATDVRPRGGERIAFTSLRDVRPTMTLDVGEASPQALLLRLHGATVAEALEESRPSWAADLPIAVAHLRVRGFPPSDSDQPIRHRTIPWILRDIEDPAQWIVRGAIADVLLAVRAARLQLGNDLPWMVEGASLGGGLAIIAAAQAAQLDDSPMRMAISMPSLGDWAFRLSHRDLGFGGLLAEHLLQLRQDGDRLRHTLALHDALLHACALQVPCFARLAHRDETVPAPAAAAIIRAIPPSSRVIHSVTYGHYDGGIADLRRHVRFEQRLGEFFDPSITFADFAHDEDATGSPTEKP